MSLTPFQLDVGSVLDSVKIPKAGAVVLFAGSIFSLSRRRRPRVLARSPNRTEKCDSILTKDVLNVEEPLETIAMGSPSSG